MKITTIIEDTRIEDRFINEMGFSLFIETRDRRILLDTGRLGGFIDNAETLGIDLTQLDACVISHAHFDHGGGLARFFDTNQTTPVFMHESAPKNYYASICAKLPLPLAHVLYPFIGRAKTFTVPIGLDQAVLDLNKDRISYISEPNQLFDDVFVITDIPHTYDMPAGNKFLLSMPGTRLETDQFLHEMILAIREPDGIVLFSGCCHNGILNMIDRVNEYFNNIPIKAVVGGFHLALQPGKDRMSLSAGDLESLGQALIDRGITNVYTGHCTGKQACDALQGCLGDRLRRLSTGNSFTL